MHHIDFQVHGLGGTRWSNPNLEAAWKLIRNVCKIMARAVSSFPVAQKHKKELQRLSSLARSVEAGLHRIHKALEMFIREAMPSCSPYP